MAAGQTLVSIGVPVYNGETFLHQTLESLLAQDYENLEINISDNGSTDGTAAICQEFASRDPRIKFHQNAKNLGPSANFRRVFELAGGRYFMWAGAHDLWHPSFISSCVEVLENDPEVVLAYTRTLLIDNGDNPLELMPDTIDTRGLNAVDSYLKIIWELGYCNMFYGIFRVEILKKHNFHRRVIIGADNVALAWVSLQGSIAQIARPLYYRRDSFSGETSEQAQNRRINIKKQAGLEFESIIPYTLLAYTHLELIAESDLAKSEKDFLSEETIRCFLSKFSSKMDQERNSLLAALRNISTDVLPEMEKDRFFRLIKAVKIFFPDAQLPDSQNGPRQVLDPDSAKPTPFISIVIPTYNRAGYLKDAIDSALAQNYEQLEILIIDDGSTDNTQAVVASFVSDKIRYVRKEHTGAPATRNCGVREAKGDFILWLDSDDVLLPDTVRSYVSLLQQFPDTDVCYGDLLITDDTLHDTGKMQYEDWFGRNAELLARLFMGNCIPNPGSLVRRACFERVGMFDESFRRAHDYEWWSRLAPVANFRHAPLTVVKWRWHDSNMSSGSVNIDLSFDARIVHLMMARHSLPELFPQVDFSRLQPQVAEGLAYMHAAQRLLNLQDIAGAMKYMRLSYELHPDGQKLTLIQQLKALLPGPDQEQDNDKVKKFSARKKLKGGHNPRGLNILMPLHSFLPDAIGGTELYTFNLAQEMQSRGHNVRIFYPEVDSKRPEGDIVADTFEGLPVSRINLNYYKNLVDNFKDEVLAAAFGRYLDSLQVDVVHFQHLINLSAALLRVCHDRGIPAVVTAHDEWLICQQCHLLRHNGRLCQGPETVDGCVNCYLERNSQFPRERTPDLFYNLALRRQYLLQAQDWMHCLLIPSRFLQQKLAAAGFQHPRTLISPLGLALFTPLPWQQSEVMRFSFLGNLTYLKGVDVLIRAFNAIKSDRARLNLYGRLVEPGYFQNALAQANQDRQIEYHGPYESADLPRILAQTDVAVIPSRSENYPLVVRECLHAGVPVIASRVGGIPEIIQDGENGLLFTPNDPQDLASKLNFFLEDPQRLLAFRQRIQPVRTIAEDAAHLEEIYHDALQNCSLQVSRSSACSLEMATAAMERQDWAAPGLERVPASIIIPVFNNLELTRNCLESIWEHTPPELYELIVVDNGSRDGTPGFLERLAAAGKIRYIRNETNLGYAKASNQGARAARGDYLVMLNNDTLVTPGWLNALIEAVEEDDKVAIVGAKLLYQDDSIQHAGVVFNKKGKVYHLYRYFHRDHPAVNKMREFQVVTGACLLIRTPLFLQVGLFDENFINGFEDVDLCLRVRQSGYRIVYNPDCVVYHLESMTPGRGAHVEENSRHINEKWQGRFIPDDHIYFHQDGLRMEWVMNATGEREAVIHDENDNPYKQEARTCLSQGDLSQALALYKLALRFNPFDPRNRALITEMESLKGMAAPQSQAVHA